MAGKTETKGGGAAGTAAGAPRKEYRVRRAAGALDWSAADLLTDFSFPWTAAEAPATRFRALWNAERLHFRYDIVDADLVLDESADPVARVIGSDRAELFFACNEALDPYYCLEMDPRGEVYDYEGRHYRKFSPEWKWPGREVAAALTREGYRVEGSVPMASFGELGLWEEEGRSLRAGVYRAEFRHRADGVVVQDWISWVDPKTERPDFHVPASFGRFVLVE